MDVPTTLRDKPNWIVWRNRNGRKIPFQTSGIEARTNDSGTWTTIDDATDHVSGYTGLGYVFDGTGVIAVDLDGCVVDGVTEPWAQEIIGRFGTYAEYSPSGTGIHLIGNGVLPGKGRRAPIKAKAPEGKEPGVEIYDRGRYFTWTGKKLPDAPAELADVQGAVDWLLGRYFKPRAPKPKPVSLSRQYSNDERLRRGAAWLDATPGAVEGQGGDKHTFYVACKLILGFDLAVGDAYPLMLQWNDKCDPPWEEKDLMRKLNLAAEKDDPRGNMLSDPTPSDVDISGLVANLTNRASVEASPPGPVDPGPIPDELLTLPGFIGEVAEFCMKTAPYPSRVLSFAGALALQSLLCARKVRDEGDVRSNLYILALAHSARGKDAPRNLNSRILTEVGMVDCLGENFASAEGLEDALYVTPAMLFQTDEMAGLIRAMAGKLDIRYTNLTRKLLSLYSNANRVLPKRPKAGDTSRDAIDQPSLTILGTAVPNCLYGSLSTEMLEDGTFSRLIIFEAEKRPPGQDPRVLDIPGRIIETAKWWKEFRPGGSLGHVHPDPVMIGPDKDARDALRATRQLSEKNYARAEGDGDDAAASLWGRVPEQARKLALLYSVSENHQEPRITRAAAEWAGRLAVHQALRMLFMVSDHVAESDADAECLKVIRKLRTAGGELPHSVLLKRMKCSAKAFAATVDTLRQRGDIVEIIEPTAGRPTRNYRLAGSESSEKGVET